MRSLPVSEVENMVLDFLFGKSESPKIEACQAFDDNKVDALRNYRNLMDANKEVADWADNTPAKAKGFEDIAESYTRSAVKHNNSGESADVKMLLEGTSIGRYELNSHGERRGYDGIQDALRLARENGATNQRIDQLESCATAIGKKFIGADYELPYKQASK